MIMKNRNNLIALYKALEAASKMGNAKFKYAALKNLKIINSEIDTLKVLETEIEEVLSEYNIEKNSIISKYGTRRDNGTISVEPDNENYQTVIEDLDKLNAKFEDSFDLYEKKRNEYIVLLNEPFDIQFKFFELNIDNVPDEFQDLEILMDFDIVK